eukprot:m.135489 g.135489  ORF g.135489 m.135489 type:complete len:94 (+) comp15848_c0_seq6:105-386(+)
MADRTRSISPSLVAFNSCRLISELIFALLPLLQGKQMNSTALMNAKEKEERSGSQMDINSRDQQMQCNKRRAIDGREDNSNRGSGRRCTDAPE